MVSAENLVSPLISVIVPCYNQAQYLNEALDSVLAQTCSYWECIIVNDGSTDDTEKISTGYCEKDDRFRYLSKENGGLSSARNAGIHQSTGTYILPLDADDIIHEDYILKVLTHFKKNPDTRIIYCQANKFGIISGYWHLKNYSYRELLIQNIIFCSAVYKRFDYFNCTTGYDEQMKNGYEDWDFWLQLLDVNDKVFQLNEVLFYYRIKKASSIYTDPGYEIEKRKYIFKKHIDKYLKYMLDPILLAQQNAMLKAVYKNSFDYRLGNIILQPIRNLISLLKKTE